ncbi:MAG: PAS domain-containing sensor histidine kinase [Chitinophagaceae bacterium]
MQFTDGAELEKTILNAPIGICLLNADTFIAELVNDKFLEVAGKPFESIFGQFYWDAFAEVRSYYESALKNVVVTGAAYYADEVEMVLIRRGKAENIFVTFVYAPIKNEAGAVTKVAVWVLENTRQVVELKKEVAAKLAFQQERDRFKGFLMQAAAGISILSGPDLIYELVNPAYEQFLAGRDLLGRPIFEAVPELVGTPLQEMLLRVYHHGEPLEVNELLVPISEYEGGPTKDRYFSFSYQPWRDEKDRIEGMLGIVFEVTGLIKVQQELKAARAAAEQQKRVYETIASGTPDLMYVWDLQYRFTYVNDALLQMWGKTWDTAVGKGLRENGYEEWHAQMHEREIDNVASTKKSVRGEVSFPHAVLGTRVYDYILVPVINELGEVEAVAGTTRDVTERKQMEEALTKSSADLQVSNEQMAAINEELAANVGGLTTANDKLASLNNQLSEARQKVAESETMLRLAIDAANFGTWFIHSVTRDFITDARLKELFGYHAEEDLSIEQALAQITDEYRGYVSDKLENAIYHGGDYDVTYPVIGLHNKRLRWLRAIGNLKVDPSGAFSAFTGVVMDVTEQKLDEQRKNDFIGMVSHELKTPLTSLSGFIQISIAKLKDNEDLFLAGAMDKAYLQVKRMTNLINGFLNVSRLESSKLLLDKKTFDLGALIEEVISEIALTVSTNEFKLQLDNTIIVNADQEKIWSVVTNLISNAIKYSTQHKVVEINSNITNGKAQVSVRDYGIGLAPEDREKVFERYFRVQNNNTRHIAGFGIGLYLSAEIIRRHDGEIWVESERSKGSTFYFTLPL